MVIGNNTGGITSGTGNTCLGNTSGPYIRTGSNNVTIGYNALYYPNANENNGYNTAVGSGATINTTNYTVNATIVGSGARVSGSNGTAIGYNAEAGANQIMLGTASETVYCPGTSGGSNAVSLIATSAINAPLFTATSDYRIKQDVHHIPSYPNIEILNPVTYQNTITGKQDMGFIAHEVQQHFPFLVSGEKDGPINQSVNYTGLIALLTKEIQDLKQRVLILEQEKK